MRKNILIHIQTSHHTHKGEPWMMAMLTFRITLFGLITYRKTIRYDVTMFDDFKQFREHWEDMIRRKLPVKYSDIKDNVIFR